MTTLTSKITRIASVAGFAVGAFALAAVAGTWTAPPCAPPGCNVDAPINVGTSTQAKQGALALGKSAPSTGYLFDVNGKGVFNDLGISGNLVVVGYASTTKLMTKTLQVTPPLVQRCTKWSYIPGQDPVCLSYTYSPDNVSGQVLTGDSVGNATWSVLPTPKLGTSGSQYKGGAATLGFDCDDGYYVTGIKYTANGDANVAGITCGKITISQ